MTKHSKLLALALRCELAVSSDHGLDEEIWSILKGKKSSGVALPITSSLDITITLVPEGCSWGITALLEMPVPYYAFVSDGPWLSVDKSAKNQRNGKTPALALTAAILRLLASQTEQ